MIPLDQFYKMCDRAHFLIGAALVLAAGMFTPMEWNAGFSFSFVVWAIWKEGYQDPRTETKEYAGSGLRDFVFYLAGVAFGWSLIAIKAMLS